MSRARALANQKLYHAKILVEYWRRALSDEDVASPVLEQAFGHAVCDHLAGAYGWFLLEICQPTSLPNTPPHGCNDLPEVADGVMVAPEVHEFIQLEREPWLDFILNPAGLSGTPPPQSSQNLALATTEVFCPEAALQLAEKLNGLFDRMTNSLDEY